jgi:integrase/recombinase XerD
MSHSTPPAPRQLLQCYFTELRADNWSPRTIERRRFSIGRFIDWAALRSIDAVNQITEDSLHAYRQSLFHHRNTRTGKPLSFGTQASYLTALKHWLYWLYEHQWLPLQLDHKIKLPKEEHRLPSGHLSLEEVGRLLSQVSLDCAEGVRDRAILEVFYATGIRRSELIALQIDDIQRSSNILSIRQGKGRRDRMVPLSDSALHWIDRYLDELRPELAGRSCEPTDTLFLTCNGNTFHPVVLSAIVRRYLTAAGIRKRGSCHILRHTAATLMLHGGADLRSIQLLLGHQQLSTTQIYTHVTITQLCDIYRRTHPAATQPSPSPETKANEDKANEDKANEANANEANANEVRANEGEAKEDKRGADQ